jgi:hypothetical protein
MAEAAKRTVVVTHHEDSVWKTEVMMRSDQAILTRTVIVDTANFTTSCPCRFFNETGRPCFEAMALIIDQNLAPHDPCWYDDVYHATIYRETFNNPSPSLTTQGRLFIDEESPLLPPNHKVTSGRPKKKRYTSTSARPRERQKCGLLGRMGISCEKPDTQYRYKKNKDAALRWAQGMVNSNP